MATTSIAVYIDTTKQKERLISLNLSLLFELAIRSTEKESLTLFLSYGISLPSDIAKVMKKFRLTLLKAIYSTKIN